MKLYDILHEGFSPSLPEGVKLRMSETESMINLSLITIPDELRGQGIFTKVINELISYADNSSKVIALTASSDFGSSKARLEKFYKSKGFVKNSGKNKDYEISEGMYRLPKSVNEGIDYAQGKKGPEIKLPIYTKTKFDYGSRSNKVTHGDIIVKASDTGNIYGRRRTAQRTLKKRSK